LFDLLLRMNMNVTGQAGTMALKNGAEQLQYHRYATAFGSRSQIHSRADDNPLAAAANNPDYTPELVVLLIQNGTVINNEGNGSEYLFVPAIEAATFHGLEDVVTALLKHGADLNITSEYFGGSPVRIAIDAHYWDIEEVLRDFGAEE
jgi:hypothetical protein